jgi:hypothetical protein
MLDVLLFALVNLAVFVAGAAWGGRRRSHVLARAMSENAHPPVLEWLGGVERNPDDDLPDATMGTHEYEAWKQNRASAATFMRTANSDTDPEHDRVDTVTINGWGVWHTTDEEWIGIGTTSGIAVEMIPAGYDHLVLRPVVARIEKAGPPEEEDFYVCPDHVATHGYESCCECGGWLTGDPNCGRLCSEAGS